MHSPKRACQVCENKLVTPLYANVMAALNGLDMSYTLARCSRCGFHFASELPDEIQYFRYYHELSKYDSQQSVTPLDKERIDAAISLCIHLDISKQARIVELEGIYQGTLTNAGDVINLQEADLVCLMAVLEHLPHLRRDLGQLFSQLRQGTRVLVEVPALDLFEGKQGEPFGELSIEHIQFFSAQSIRNLFASLGAHVLYEKFLPISGLHSGSLFVMAEIAAISSLEIQAENPQKMDEYLAESSQRWSTALKHIPDQPFVLYGAGSHSARLLPRLNKQQRSNLFAIVDGNVNLHGKSFGEWLVEPPIALSKYPSKPVLISSYRSELAIAADLRQRFPKQRIRLMYSHV